MRADRPSATALLIAKSQIMLAKSASLNWAVGPDRERVYGRCMLEALGGDWRLGLAESARLFLMEKLGVPGIYLHYALRKLRIERLTRTLLDAGEIQQVIVVAAGFDPMCVLLHRSYGEVGWFELDHPATQRVKSSALSQLDVDANLSLLPIDLTCQPIADLFISGQVRSDVPTLVIVEGITMYLTESQIGPLLGDIRRCTKPGGSFLLFTYMNRQTDGAIDFESASLLARCWLAIKQERFVWGIQANKLVSFLDEQHYALVDQWDAVSQRDEYLKGKNQNRYRLAVGENIALARTDP